MFFFSFKLDLAQFKTQVLHQFNTFLFLYCKLHKGLGFRAKFGEEGWAGPATSPPWVGRERGWEEKREEISSSWSPWVAGATVAGLQGVRGPLHSGMEVFLEPFSTLDSFNTWYVGSALPLNSCVLFPGSTEISEAHRDPERDAITPTSPLSTGQDNLGLHTALSEKQHQFCLHLGSRLQNSAPGAGGLPLLPLLQASPMTWRGLLEVPPKIWLQRRHKCCTPQRLRLLPLSHSGFSLQSPWPRSEVEGRLTESSR